MSFRCVEFSDKALYPKAENLLKVSLNSMSEGTLVFHNRGQTGAQACVLIRSQVVELHRRLGEWLGAGPQEAPLWRDC